MPVISSMDVALARDEVLARLPLSSPAFSTRAAPALVTGLLDSIAQDRLVTSRACYEFVRIDRVAGRRIELDGDCVLIAETPLTGIDGADSLLLAAWTLGPRISTAVSEAFAQRQYLAGFLLHEIASLLLFRLGETLFDQLSGKIAARGANIGMAIAPGDGCLGLSAQKTVLSLAGAGRINIDGGVDSPMSPLKSATAIAPVGRAVKRPRYRWDCEQCRVRDTCRLRHGRTTDHDHERLC
jgi:hypothetical protein